jgi:DNA-binding beta-propeller fold protein YncE
MMMLIKEGYDRFLSRCLTLWLALVLLFMSVPLPAKADGGAPNLAYVAGTSHGISVIDIAQQKVTGTIAVDGDPHTILLSLDGRYLYVTQPAQGRIAIIAARTGQTVCTADLHGYPTLLALSADGVVLYAAGNEGNISTINSTTCVVQQTFQTNDQLYGMAVVGVTSGNSFSDQLFVAATTSLMVFDEKGHQLESIPVPGGPQYLSMPGGSTVYITTRQGNVVALDESTGQVSPPLLLDGKFGPMDYDAITGEIYVPDQQHNQLDVLAPFSPVTGSSPTGPSSIIHLSGSPQAVAITSDGQLGFVALAGGKVAMLDIPGRQIINTISVGGTPHFIIAGLYPPAIGTTPQEASVWSTVINIAAFVLVIALFIVPLLLFRRYSQLNNKKKKR